MKQQSIIKNIIFIFLAIFSTIQVNAVEVSIITNVYGRNITSLNGKWNILVDPYDYGLHLGFPKNRKPKINTDFVEYSFENALRLNVPSDWNSQLPELSLYEGTVWYSKYLNLKIEPSIRQFLYFNAVNYRCRIYLNGEMIKEHEGGFTPFQVEITNRIKNNENFLVVEVNNKRTKDAIPSVSFDWWNYGGITRDVFLVKTPQVYIHDYFVRLNKYKPNKIDINIKLSEKVLGEEILIKIPELNVNSYFKTDSTGSITASLTVKKLNRWSPENPKLYNVILSHNLEKIEELIGFRNVFVKGQDIFLNNKPIFLKGINFHEEIAQRKGRAFSESDANVLLSEAKALGANMIRLAHYPQNEYIVRLAEKMGFMLWEEIPVWQGIDFSNNETQLKAGNMISEMITRDKNRCALTFIGIANETQPSIERNIFLKYLIKCCKDIDTTRLITAAFDLPQFNKKNKTFEMKDDFVDQLDVVAVNKYIGWYMPWPADPAEIKWNISQNKPLIFSEFGGEALYGNTGNVDTASSWSEEYQEKLYKDNLIMFSNIPNLKGICPWILFDFRSPLRFHPLNQEGWNRKGLVSDQGYRKKAWYIMKKYYEQIK